MSKQEAAMRQALEALEQLVGMGNADTAIIALREALEQPEQQEPVAKLLVGCDSDGRYVSLETNFHSDALPLGEYGLYTHPQAKQEQPAPPPECQTQAEKTAFAFGWWKAMEYMREKDRDLSPLP